MACQKNPFTHIMFILRPFTKIVQRVPLRQTKRPSLPTRAKGEHYLNNVCSWYELLAQIQNNFTQIFLIIKALLPKLPNWLCSSDRTSAEAKNRTRYTRYFHLVQIQKHECFPLIKKFLILPSTKNSEYDQKIPQSRTADKPMASWWRATQQSWDTRKTNKAKQPALSSHRDDCKTRMDTLQFER